MNQVKIIETVNMKFGPSGRYSIEQLPLQDNNKSTKISYLKKLTGIFSDGYAWMKVVEDELLKNNFGITGNWIDVIIQNDKVTIELDEEEIEIDRQVLIDIIKKFDQLWKKNCPRITFTRYEDGTIDVTDGTLTADR